MNLIELYVRNGASWEALDFDGNLTLNENFYDTEDPFAQGVVYSFASTMNITKRNRELLGYDLRTNNRIDVRLYVNGVFMKEGYIKITKKTEKSFNFNYIDITTRLNELLNDNYTFNLEIDTRKYYEDTNYLGLSTFDLPDSSRTIINFAKIINQINENEEDYKIGISDTGRKDLFYYETPNLANLQEQYDKTSYQTYLTGAPTFFRREDFHISTKVSNLLNNLMDTLNTNNNTNYYINTSNINIENLWVMLKKDDDLTIKPFFNKDLTEDRESQFFGKVARNPLPIKDLIIDTYDNFDIKISSNQLQRFMTNSDLIGSINYTQIDFINSYNRDLETGVTIFISPRTDTTFDQDYTSGPNTSGYSKQSYNFRIQVYSKDNNITYDDGISNSTTDGTFNFDFIIPQGGRLYIQYSNIGNFENTRNQYLEDYDYEIYIREKVIDPFDPSIDFDYILNDSYTYNLIDLLKKVAYWTNSHITINKNEIKFISNEFERIDENFTGDWIESEQQDTKFLDFKRDSNLIYVTSENDEKWIKSDLMRLDNDTTYLSLYSNVDVGSTASINYADNYFFDFEREGNNFLMSRYSNQLLELLSTKVTREKNVRNNKVKNYVSEDEYVKMMMGYPVFKNGVNITTTQDISFQGIENPPVGTYSNFKRQIKDPEGIYIVDNRVPGAVNKNIIYFKKNETYKGDEDSWLNILNTGSNNSFNINTLKATFKLSDPDVLVTDITDSLYNMKVKVSSRGVIRERPVNLSFTSSVTEQALMTRIRDQFKFLTDTDANQIWSNDYTTNGTTASQAFRVTYTNPTSGATSSFNITSTYDFHSYFFEVILTQKQSSLGTLKSYGVIEWSDGRWYRSDEEYKRDINIGIIKNSDYPPLPIVDRVNDLTYLNELMAGATSSQFNIVNIHYKDITDLDDQRGKVLDNYTCYKTRYIDSTLRNQFRRRTFDDVVSNTDDEDFYPNILNKFQLSMGRNSFIFSLLDDTKINEKHYSFQQWKWVPDLDIEDNRQVFNTSETIFHTIDTTYFNRGITQSKVFISYKNQYSQLCPILYKSVFNNIHNNFNLFLYDNFYGKDYHYFYVKINVWDYQKLVTNNKNNIITINGEDYYLLNMEWNIRDGIAKVKTIRKIDFSI